MKKISLLISFILIHFFATAQYTLKLVITQVATKQNDDIYVAGNFNDWNTGDAQYKLKPFAGGRKVIVIKNLAAGNYAFKFTRGNWQTVETTDDGRDIENRIIEINSDVTLDISIPGWKDDYPKKPKPYTASPNVRVMDTAFFIPQLNRKRKIWIYLPKNYASVGKAYPVLYMQDAQNLFNEQTAFNGEWGVDECLDSLHRKTGKECIVVGIENSGEKRVTEYSPYNYNINKTMQVQEGTAYVDFIVNTLKPFIDNKYRTQKTSANTAIAGSSLGGLISCYALLKYPDVFGSAGIFSPSFWVSNEIYTLAEQFNTKSNIRLYLYAGGKESTSLIAETKKMATIIASKTANTQVTTSINPNGEHNEKYWRQEFANFYLWWVK